MAFEPQTMPVPGTPPGQKIDGSKIRRLREEKGLTQLYVATVVGVTTDTISRWENRRYPSIKPDNAARLAEALGVPVAAILDLQTEQADEGGLAATQPDQAGPNLSPRPRRRPRYLGLALFLALSIGLVLRAWWLNTQQSGQISAVRKLPAHAPIGLLFPVAITVTPPPSGAIPLIISETVVPGCSAIDGVPPFTAVNSETRTIKWIAKPDGPTTFYYMAIIKPQTQIMPVVAFQGEITLHRDSGAMTQIGGADSVTVAPFHWADSNRDHTIDDEEILAVYDNFGTANGLNLEASMLEDIWSGHGYSWDEARHQLVVIP